MSQDEGAGEVLLRRAPPAGVVSLPTGDREHAEADGGDGSQQPKCDPRECVGIGSEVDDPEAETKEGE